MSACEHIFKAMAKVNKESWVEFVEPPPSLRVGYRSVQVLQSLNVMASCKFTTVTKRTSDQRPACGQVWASFSMRIIVNQAAANLEELWLYGIHVAA